MFRVPRQVAAATSEGTGGGTTATDTTGAEKTGDTTTTATTGDGTTQPGATDDKGTTSGAGSDGNAGGKETGSKAGEGDPAPKAPAEYDLKVPEGGEQYLGPDDMKYLSEVGRASDWTQEDMTAELTAIVDRAKAREAAQEAALVAELKADKDYGGEKLETTQRQARAAIDKVFPPGHRLRDTFLRTFDRGIVGNNLTYVAFLAEVGRMMGEDRTGATRAGGAETSTANTLYDHPTSRALDSR